MENQHPTSQNRPEGTARPLSRREWMKRGVHLTAWTAMGPGAARAATERAKGKKKASLDGAEPPGQIALNEGEKSYDQHFSIQDFPDGSCWIVWKAYYMSRERVVARYVDSTGRPGSMISLTDKPGILDGPVCVGERPDVVWVVWSSYEDDHWKIVGRRVTTKNLSPREVLSDPQSHAIKPAAAVLDGGRVLVAWHGHKDGLFRVWTRLFDGKQWREAVCASPPAEPSFRAALIGDGIHVWAIWDRYVDQQYAVVGRPVMPNLGGVETISPAGQNCLKAVTLNSKSRGFCVGFLRVEDAIAAEGVIDQWQTLHMAVRRDGKWQMVADAEGSTEATHLAHGIQPRMEPTPEWGSGYLGRLRDPMLAESGNAVWLLWERKTEHRGGATKTVGELVGRPCRGETWGDPVILHRGLLDYRVAPLAHPRGGAFHLVGSDLPRLRRRTYFHLLADPANRLPFQQEMRTGWRPVKLPLDERPAERYAIQSRGRTYQLYWADLHCHSDLSSDAEGEPDEIIQYARDRAQIDVMVLQDNDEIYDCPLTESEYQLGVTHSVLYTQPGEFVALPGYEWTQRLPKEGPYDPSKAAEWKGTFPNHRTIVYPPASGPIVRHTEIAGDFQKLCDAVEKAGGVMHTQHDTWVITDRACDASVEVAACWGIYIQTNTDLFHAALNSGKRLGFIANSDSHRRNPGLGGALTGIYAESLTPEAILEALRNHRVFATNGSRIVLESWANGKFMGEEVAASGEVKITLTVIAPKPVTTAKLVRDGKVMKTVSGDGSRTLRCDFVDRALPKGRHWYYWAVEQEGTSPNYPGNIKIARGHLAWATPHYVVAQ